MRFQLRLSNAVDHRLMIVGEYMNFAEGYDAFQKAKLAFPTNSLELSMVGGTVLRYWNGQAEPTYQIIMNKDQVGQIICGLKLLQDQLVSVDKMDDELMELGMLIDMFKELPPNGDKETIHGFCL